ncbi:MAG: NAD(P)/FAD-dependent oxidoreductase [Microcoleaceae cyanobacterium]
MTRIAIVGCGVVGAAIAYELSRIDCLSLIVFDQQSPAQASTGAALGILVGIISQKTKGRAWELRQRSIRRYHTLIPELESILGQSIPGNRHGLLDLQFAGANLQVWQNLIEIRREQGWCLELLDPEQVQARYPKINCEGVTGAVYSPQDQQIEPIALTLALVEAARKNGVNFQFGTTVQPIASKDHWQSPHVLKGLQTSRGNWPVDAVILASGLGTSAVSHTAPRMQPVLGQAMRLRLNTTLDPNLPVVSGEDVHIVPLNSHECWIGATVEFSTGEDLEEVTADPERMTTVQEQAIQMYPDLAHAEMVDYWSGLRPRPVGQSAPVIEPLPGFSNILLATGHYRNGVLLAPATAEIVRDRLGEILEHRKRQ